MEASIILQSNKETTIQLKKPTQIPLKIIVKQAYTIKSWQLRCVNPYPTPILTVLTTSGQIIFDALNFHHHYLTTLDQKAIAKLTCEPEARDPGLNWIWQPFLLKEDLKKSNSQGLCPVLWRINPGQES